MSTASATPIESHASGAFPLLTAGEIVDWIRLPDTAEYTDLEWSDDLASWIRETLLPRVPKVAES